MKSLASGFPTRLFTPSYTTAQSSRQGEADVTDRITQYDPMQI